MPSIEQLTCFVVAAESGSFSAAARQLGKVQSAVSTAISNLEIDANLELFDRSSRSPVLTEAGQMLLKSAKTVLHSHHEFNAHAASLSSSNEASLCIAIEQNVATPILLTVLERFANTFPYITLELLDPGSGDVAELLRSNRADIGLMIQQEYYPQGFSFRGIGHSRVIPVSAPDFPLAQMKQVTLADLRQHRQVVGRSLDPDNQMHERYTLSPQVWLSESPFVILELLCANIGWAFLHEAVVKEKLHSGELVVLDLVYEQADILQGIDLVWTENRALGKAGQWLLQQLQSLRFEE
ncbi:LysR family transcriptional regulator [Neptunomonas qingdaonensis]|uniref:DNA-binding transcriptional regulator, LysR family n=1 Tax=Neptunomonas qingdaonensis TaxID=1045558 RepID=A0A1I2SEY5_9GAMM|nr:LysR family transcriptional regulator [Neptunomonas qingdaonensis]SFG48666.1 DNA-binding transcriptional regulator, LysR family [Neptunomonas qingdaonensis]